MSSTKIGVGSDAAAGREIRAVTVAAMSRHGSIRFGTDSSRISSGIRLPREGDVLSIDPSTVRGDSAFGSPPSQTVASACTTLTSAKQTAPAKSFGIRLTMRRMHHRTDLGHACRFGPRVSPTSWNPDLFRVAQAGIGCCARRDQPGIGPEPVVQLGNVAGVDVFIAQLCKLFRRQRFFVSPFHCAYFSD